MVLDELPQPFRFVNKCLDEMIMKPVMQAIAKIEDRKKTSEYEGFLREATATGSMDLEAATCMAKIGASVGAGGVIEKEQSSSHKILIGDNMGKIHMMDIQKKILLDSFDLPECDGRRVLNIHSCTVDWVGT